jgi:type IV pilus assembly protein PilE
MRCKGSRGFTLIELLIAVVVVAILAAIAIPSYSAYVIRGQRAAAKATLQQAQQWLERNYTASGCYNYTDAASCGAQSGNAIAWPFTGAPANGGGTITYALPTPSWTIPTGNPAAPGQYFVLTATPCGSSGSCPTGSNTNFTDPDCGSLLLQSTGQKGINVSGSADWASAQSVSCWGR